MDEQSWLRLMRDLSIDDNLATFRKLKAAYAEKHRHYHTSAHIEACLALFSEHRSSASKPADVECAIWFHDAIYNPMSGDNEKKSADWAVRFLQENDFTDEQCERVRSLIMATIHEAPANDPDTQFLVDIDLSILGADKSTYQKFENDVRREYKWVPGPLFRRERRKILQSFLDRETIYSTSAIRAKYETQARANMVAALKSIDLRL